MRLCLTPELAAEVTLQPIRRFGFDAAIVFSDILVVPLALGHAVTFAEGVGPRVSPAYAELGEREWDALLDRPFDCGVFDPVFDTVRRVRGRLSATTPLIGFCGAPWTVATYLVAGAADADQERTRRFAACEPVRFEWLIRRITEISVSYLRGQIAHGAQVVQIFDSWAGVLGPGAFDAWCVQPVRAMIQAVRAAARDVPIIYFPRGAGAHAMRVIEQCAPDVLAVDWTFDIAGFVARGAPCVLQGNLDPLTLQIGGDALRGEIASLLDAVRNRPHIVNLGHGIRPDTPIENVEHMIRQVRRAGADSHDPGADRS